VAMKRSPNTRMQRTRSSPSALRSPLMRSPLGGPQSALLAVGLVLGSAIGCKRVHTYEMAADAKPGWVAIEFENASCPAIPSGGLSRAIHVPASRYVCFSDPIDHGLAASFYYQARPDGGKRRLVQEEEIWGEGAFGHGFGEGPCRMVGELFFFGPKSALKQSQDFGPFYPLHHQGCDPNKLNTGHGSF